MLIVSIIIFLILSALFSGTEIAFVSASKLQVELKKNKGGRRGRLFASFFDEPGRFLSTMLVGNNIALVFFSLLATDLLIQVLPIEGKLLELLIYTLITTVVVLIFGEFLPKTMFRLFPNQILYNLAYPLRIIELLLVPISWIMVQLSNLIIKLFVKSSEEKVEQIFTRRDLENFIKKAQVATTKTKLIRNCLKKRCICAIFV